MYVGGTLCLNALLLFMLDVCMCLIIVDLNCVYVVCVLMLC